MDLIRRSAAWIRNALVAAGAVLATGLVLFSGTRLIMPPQPLSTGTHIAKIEGRPFSFLRRHRLEAHFASGKLSDYDITLTSKLGHFRVDSSAPFSLPVFFRDSLLIRVSGPARGSVQMLDVRTASRLLPGAWLLVAGLVLGIFYFHGLCQRTLTKETCTKYLLVAGSTLVSLALLTAFVQVLGPRTVERKEPWQLFPPRFQQRIRIFPNICPGIPPGEVIFRMNSEGIRARERWPDWAATFSVLCVGASTTECSLLDQETQWPGALERRLQSLKGTNVWVGNAGRSGYSTARVIEVAGNYVPRVKPKCLVVLTGFNEGLVPEERPSALASESNPSLPSRLANRADHIVMLNLIRRTLFNYTALSPNDVLFGENNLAYEKLRQKSQLDAMLTPPRERTWEDLDLSQFDNELRALHDFAQQYQARLVLCTQPTIYRTNMSPADEQLLWMMGNYTPGSKRRKMDLVNAHIRKAAAEFGAGLVDLDRELPRTTEVFYDDCHFNVHGAEMVAEAVFKCLASQP